MRAHSPRVLVALGVAMALGAGPAAPQVDGQAAAWRDGGGWEPPRTEWGHPDLQGNWSNATLTPLERADGHAPTYTAEEVAAIEGRAEARLRRALEPSDPDRGAPPVGGDGSTGAAGGVGGYNGVYIDRGDRVAVVNGEPRASLLTRPADGRIPELTAEGRMRVREARRERARFGRYDHPEVRPLGERCIVSFGSNAGPPMLPNGFYNNTYTIAQNEDHVVVMAEMVHDARIIPLGDAAPLPSHIRPWFGRSRGRWEGNTLVVETTAIHPEQTLRGVAPSEERRVVERFTRVGPETILYEFMVHDPVVYTEPWGGQVPMTALVGRVYEYACHEANYSLENILSGARYQERQEVETRQ